MKAKDSSVDDVLFAAPVESAERERVTAWGQPSGSEEPSFRETEGARHLGAAGHGAAIEPAEPIDETPTAWQPEGAPSLRQAASCLQPLVAPSMAARLATATSSSRSVLFAAASAVCAATAWFWFSAGGPVGGTLAALLGLGLLAFARFAMRG